MIVSTPPLRILWPATSAYELDHGTMDMPRDGAVRARSHSYPLTGAPTGIAEVHIEHWTASDTSLGDEGETGIGASDHTTNANRAGFIGWLDKNAALAVQYAHRRVRRFAHVDGTDGSGNSVVPDPTEKGDAIIEIKADGALFATGLRRATTGGSRVLWKLAGDLLATPTYELVVGSAAPNLSAQDFIDNKSGDPGYLSSVEHAFWEDVSDFPGGPGTGGSNVPGD